VIFVSKHLIEDIRLSAMANYCAASSLRAVIPYPKHSLQSRVGNQGHQTDDEIQGFEGHLRRFITVGCLLDLDPDERERVECDSTRPHCARRDSRAHARLQVRARRPRTRAMSWPHEGVGAVHTPNHGQKASLGLSIDSRMSSPGSKNSNIASQPPSPFT